MTEAGFDNPFRPGAGHMPPFLAGRESESDEFLRLLDQKTILTNVVLTGLRGVGKTVLLETLKPKAIKAGWAWVGADLSESTSISEESLARRLLTDIAPLTSDVTIARKEVESIGFQPQVSIEDTRLDYAALETIYRQTPGLVADKIKTVLELVWRCLRTPERRGVVFAYDEAQNMSNHKQKEQYPLSLLLDVFQAIQRRGIPFMLALTGLPTVFPKLVEARTFAERMFHVITLKRLSDRAATDAIVKPIEAAACPVRLSDESVALIVKDSGCYPYFIQFICREVYDSFLQKMRVGVEPSVPQAEIVRKLDNDFFAGRWAKATDRQRDLLAVIANLESCDDEFTVQEVVALSKRLGCKAFSPSHVSQMLVALSNHGLVYKNRHGKYSFAVPLFGQFIRRQTEDLPWMN